MQVLKKYGDKSDLLGIQETHGNLADALELWKSVGSSHFAAWSPAEAEMVDFGLGKFVCGSFDRSGVVRSELHEEDRDSDTDSSSNGVTSQGDSSDESRESAASSHSFSETKSKSVQESFSMRGGMFNLIRRSAFGHSAQCTHLALVPGRCLVSKILDGSKTTTFVNIHFSTLALNKQILFMISSTNRTS